MTGTTKHQQEQDKAAGEPLAEAIAHHPAEPDTMDHNPPHGDPTRATAGSSDQSHFLDLSHEQVAGHSLAEVVSREPAVADDGQGTPYHAAEKAGELQHVKQA